MGQHKHNPTAQAAKAGQIKKATRAPREPFVSSFVKSVLALVGVGNTKPYYEDANGSIRRRFPKVKGKANVKLAKRARRIAREQAAA